MRSLPIAVACVVLAACGGDTSSSDGGVDLGVDAPFMVPDGDGHGPAVPGLGDPCVGEPCLAAAPCVTTARACSTGLCLVDPSAPLLAGAYCTVTCAPTPCPADYHCVPAYGTAGAACVAIAAVCGDGAVERGEQCDDGNTTPGDGCDAHCFLEPPIPPTVAADVSLTATELAPDGGATPRVAVVHVESRLDAPAACGHATSGGDGGVLASDAGTFDPVVLRACPTFGEADVAATLAWAPGDYDVDTPTGGYTLAVCANLRFADAPGCAQRYCATTGATPSSATWTVTPGDGGVHGTLMAHLARSGAPVADPDGGCTPVYGDSLDVGAVVDESR